MVPYLCRATSEDIPFLQNLAAYYIYDMSEFTHWPISADGRYGCRDASFWDAPRFEKWLIRVRGEPAGFAAVDTAYPDSRVDLDMAEFFVLRKFRHAGIGGAAATQLFGTYRGRWLVRVLPENAPALAFWRRVIEEFASGHYTVERVHVPALQCDMVAHRFDA